MGLQNIKNLAFLNLLSTRRFSPLFITQFLGAFNDNFFKNALIILIAFQENNILGFAPKEMVALSAAIFILPFFIFSAFAGILADNINKIYIARGVKITELLIMLLAAYGFISGYFGLLLLCLFLMGIHSAFFGPVKYAILPQHLKPNELLNGNALVGAATFIAILLGTVFGGLVVSFGEKGVIFLIITMVTISIIGLLSSWLIPSAPKDIKNNSRPKISFNFYRSSIQVLKLSYTNKSIFIAIIFYSWFWFIGVAYLSLIPPYVKEILKGDQKLATVFLGIFTIGIGIGAFLCALISKNKINLKLVPIGGLLLSCCSGLIGLVSSVKFTMLLFLFACIGGGLYSIPLITYIQQQTKNEQRSQIISACNILNAFAMVVSSQLIIFLFKMGIKIPNIFMIIAGLNIFFILLLWLIFIKKDNPTQSNL